MNGRPVGNYMRHLSGFMHQDDLFVGSLTVWEHMNFMVCFIIKILKITPPHPPKFENRDSKF